MNSNIKFKSGNMFYAPDSWDREVSFTVACDEPLANLEMSKGSWTTSVDQLQKSFVELQAAMSNFAGTASEVSRVLWRYGRGSFKTLK